MQTFAPTSSFITGQQFSTSTQQFLQQAQPGSLTATLYELPANQQSLTHAGRIILNVGGRLDRAEVQARANFIQQEQAAGVDVRTFSVPTATQHLHAKTYTATIGQTPTAYIATGNLSAGSLKEAPTNLAQRLQAYASQKTVAQKNLAYQTNDPAIVRQLAQFQSQLAQGRIPGSSQNILVGGRVSSTVVDRLAHAQQGDKVVLSSPYIDDKRVVAALITAKERGANVTVISSNHDSSIAQATGGSAQAATALELLQTSGIKVITPTKDDPLLLHTKALAIVSERGRSSFFLGSHNFTTAANQDRSVDLMLLLNDKSLASQLAKDLGSLESAYQLETLKVSNGAARMSGVERRMYLKGTGSLYKTNVNFINPLTPKEQLADTPVEGAMPYYPTRMDSSFFDFFLKRDLPAVSIYSDLWKARMDTPVPKAIQQLDREMADPGLGHTFNRLVHNKVYEEGFGVIGSALGTVGRVADWVLGASVYEQAKKERQGDYRGTIKKLLATQYDQQKPQPTGPFESALQNIYSLGAATASTLGFYVAVNLPLQYIRARFESDYANFLIQRAEKAPNVLAQLGQSLAPIMRLVTFGPTIGGAFNSVIQDPAVDRANFANKLYDKLYNADHVRRDLDRIARTRDGRLTQIEMGDEGLYAITEGVRRFDQQRFGLVKQFLEAMNPYQSGSHYDDLYGKALSKLETTVNQNAHIEFKQAADNPGIYEPTFRQIGVERVSALARGYDEIAALLPANLTYWAPPLRRVLGLEAFDPSKHMTMGEFASFESSIKWTAHFYNQLTTVVKDPSRAVRQVTSAWRGELNITRLERQVLSAAAAQKVMGSLTVPTLRTDLDDPALALQDILAQKQDAHLQRAADIQALLQDDRYVRYRTALNEQQRLLEQSPFKTINRTLNKENPFKAIDSEAGKRLAKTRGLLTKVGLFLLADQLADKFIFQNIGATLLTQLQAHRELESPDGTVARFQFTGVVSRQTTLAVQLSAGIAAGLLLPDALDISQRPGRLLAQVEPMTRLQRQFSASEKAVLQNAGAPLRESLELIEQRALTKEAVKTYRQAYQELQALAGRRVGLRFNTTAALGAAFLAGFGLKALATGAAALANFAYSRNDPAVTPSSTNAYFSAMFEQLTVAAQSTATTRLDYANLGVGQLLAAQYLGTTGRTNRVLNFATQLTSPFIQVPVAVSVDTAKGVAKLSVGVQLLPALGLGATPVLPFSLNLKPPKDQTELIAQLDPNHYGPMTVAGLALKGLVGAFTFGSGLTYERSSGFERGMEFIALTSAIAAVNPATVRRGLVKQFGTSSALVKELDDFNRQTKVVRQMAAGVLEFSNRSLRFMYALPPLLVSNTAKGASAAFRLELPRVPKALGRFAPYYLSLTMARLMADPQADAGMVGGNFTNPVTQISGTLGAGLLTGFLLDRSGAFRDQDFLADRFQASTKKLTLKEYRELLNPLLPQVRTDQKVLAQETDELVETLFKQRLGADLKPGLSGGSFIPRKLLAEMAGPTLWQRALDERDRNLLALPAEVAGMRRIGRGAQQLLGELPYAQMRTLGARVAAAAIAITGIRFAAFAAASVLDPQVLQSLYNVPVLGPTFNLLAGIGPKFDPLEAKLQQVYRLQKGGQNGSQSKAIYATPQAGLGGIVNKLLSTLSFGTLGLPGATGSYASGQDPFLDVAGPFGLSFKPKRVGSYLQFSSSFTDLSGSAYDMLKGGSSPDLLFTTLATLYGGKARSLNEALAKVRGAVARKKPATYDSLTNYELAAPTMSAGISRALSVRHQQLLHLSGQRASELFLDYLQQGYAAGKTGSDVITGYKLPGSYNPFSFLRRADLLLTQNPLLSNGQMASVDPDQQIMDWYQYTNSQKHTVIQGFNALNLSSDLAKLPNAGVLSTPLTIVLAGTFLYGAAEFVTGAAAHFSTTQTQKLVESSRLSQGLKLTNPKRYLFTSGELPGTQKHVIFQVDRTNRGQRVYRLALNVQEALETSATTTYDLVTSLTRSYTALHQDFNAYFAERYQQEVQTLLTSGATATARQTFRSQVSAQAEAVFTQAMSRRLLPDHPLTLFGAFTGSTVTSPAFEQFQTQTRTLLEESLDEVLEALDGLKPETDTYRQVLTLHSRLEASAAFKQLTLKLQEPIVGRFSLQGERAAYQYQRSSASRFRVGAMSAESAARVPPEGALQRSKLNRLVRQVEGVTWTEGATTKALQATKGLAGLVGEWVSTGRSLYEVSEAAAVLAGGQSQSLYMRTVAAKQLLNSGAFWALGSTVAAGVAALGAGPLVAAGAFLAATFGLDLLKQKLRWVRGLETQTVSRLAGFIAAPVNTTARLLDHVHLGGVIRLGGLLLSPISAALSFVTRPVRGFFQQVTGALIRQQTQGLYRDPVPLQMIKAMLLPSSVYAQLDGSEGAASTLAGRSPFWLGDATTLLQQAQLKRIQQAISGPTQISTELLHPYLQGSANSPGETLFQERYLHSYTGTRVLSDFGPGSARISNTLRLALERRQFLYDSLVTSHAISKAPEPVDQSAYTYLFSAAAALGRSQARTLDRNVYGALRTELSTAAGHTTAIATRLAVNVESFVNGRLPSLRPTLPVGMQRAVRYRYLQGLRTLRPTLRQFGESLTAFSQNLGLELPELKPRLPALRTFNFDSLSQLREHPVVLSSAEALLNGLDFVNSAVSNTTGALGRLASQATSPLFNRISRFSNQVVEAVSRWGGFQLPNWAEQLAAKLPVPQESIPLNLRDLTNKGYYRLVRPLQTVGEGLGKGMATMTERGPAALFGTLGDLHIPAGAAPLGLLTGLQYATAVVSDYRLRALTPQSTFKETQRAYQETSSGVVGFAVGVLTANLTRNPLTALVGALVGGWLGDSISDSLARANYKKQQHPLVNYLQQSLLVSALVTATQLPQLLKLSRGAALSRVLINTGLSFATGGLGPLTQLTTVSQLSDAIEFAKQNRVAIGSALNSTRRFLGEAPATVQFLLGRRSAVSAVEPLRDLVQGLLQAESLAPTALDAVTVRFSGSRFAIGGEYASRTQLLSFTQATQDVLGRAHAGRYVNPAALAKAQFTVFHETFHALELNGPLPTVVHELDDPRTARLVDALSKQSTLRLAQDYPLGADLLQQVYGQEASANVRALRAFERTAPQQYSRLLRTLERGVRPALINERYDLLMEQAASHAVLEDPGVRFRSQIEPGSFKSLRAIAVDLAQAPQRLLQALRGPTTVVNLPDLPGRPGNYFSRISPTNTTEIKAAAELMSMDLSELGGLRPVGRAFVAGLGSFQLVNSGSDAALHVLGQTLDELGYGAQRVARPFLRVGSQLNQRLQRVGLDGFDVLHNLFLAVNVAQGMVSNQTYHQLNQQLRGADASTVRHYHQAIKHARNEQLRSTGENTSGLLASFVTKNPLYAMGAAAAATLILPAFEFFGLTNYFAKRDEEAAAQGHAIYNPVQSLSYYTRLNREFEVAKAATQYLTAPFRQGVKTAVRATLSLLKEPTLKSLKTLYRAGTFVTALGTATLSFATAGFSAGLAGAAGLVGVGLHNALKLGRFASSTFSQITGIALEQLQRAGVLTYHLTKPGVDLMVNLATTVGQRLEAVSTRLVTGVSTRLSSLATRLEGRLGRYVEAFAQAVPQFIDFVNPDYLLPGLKSLAGGVGRVARTVGVFTLTQVRVLADGLREAGYLQRGMRFGARVLGSLTEGLVTRAFLPLSSQTLKVLQRVGALTLSTGRRVLQLTTDLAPKALESIVNTARRSLSVAAPLLNGVGRATADFSSLMSKVARRTGQLVFTHALGAAKFVSPLASRVFSLSAAGLGAITEATLRLSTVVLKHSSEGLLSLARTGRAVFQTGLRALEALLPAVRPVGKLVVGLVRGGGDFLLKSLNTLSQLEFPNLRRVGRVLSSVGQSVLTLTQRTALQVWERTAALTTAGMTKVSDLSEFLLTGVRRLNLPGLAASARLASTKLLTSTLRFAGALATRATDSMTRVISKGMPRLGEHILALGYREALLSAIGPLFDLSTFGSGVSKALRLNAGSSLSEVEEAYVQAGAGRGALVGSVFGAFSGGLLGDAISSVVGQVSGEELAKKRAYLRWQAQDYGVVPMLEDMVEPLGRELVLAQAGGSLVGRGVSNVAGRYLASVSSRVAAGQAGRFERVVAGTSKAMREAAEHQAATAASRFERVLGKVPETGVLKAAGKATGFIPKVAGKTLRVLGPVIDLVRVGAGLFSSQKAHTAAQYQTSIERTSGGLGSLGGGLIGGAFGGPIGAVVGSLVGDTLMSGVGRDLAGKARERGVSAGTITAGQVAGAVVGTVVGVLGAAALIAGGIVAGAVALPVLAIAAGIGLIGGAIVGGYSMLVGHQKHRVDNVKRNAQTRLDNTKHYLAISQHEASSLDNGLTKRDLQVHQMGLDLEASKQGGFSFRSVLDGFKNNIGRFVGGVGRIIAQPGQFLKKIVDDRLNFYKNIAKALVKPIQSAVEATQGLVGSIEGSMGGQLAPVTLPTGLTAEGQRMASYLRNPNIRALLDTIARAEGADYQTAYGGGKLSNLQQHPFYGRELTPGGGSSASGRYQFMGNTWKEAAGRLGLRDFSPVAQDIGAVKKLSDRGVLELAAKGDIQAAWSALGREWASFEGNPYGQGTNQGLRASAIPYFEARRKVYAAQSSGTEGGGLVGVGVGNVGKYDIWSLGGRRFGEKQVTRADDLLPHWEGTGGYVRYRTVNGKLKSFLDSGLRVVDMALEQKGSNSVVVPSPVAGTVVQAGFAGGGLGVIALRDSSGTVTRVLHNKTIDVKVGQHVNYGQRLGIQGSTGETSSAVHVHLETTEAILQNYVRSLTTGTFGSPVGSPVGSGSQQRQGSQGVIQRSQPLTESRQVIAKQAGAAIGRTYLRLTRTLSKDQYGGEWLNLQKVDAKGRVVDQLKVVSGIPGRQNFRTAAQSGSGSFEPVPEGTYNLSKPEWAQSYGAGLGPMWVDVTPRMATARGSIGIHLDANRSYSPGTAGCIGIVEQSQLSKVSGWINSGANLLVVDYGLGSLPKGYQGTPVAQVLKESRALVAGQVVQKALQQSGPHAGNILTQAQGYQLATAAIMEAATRVGRVDVAQSIFNRMNAGKVGGAGYGKTVTDVIFAQGQYESVFGLSRSQLQTKEDAIRVLSQRRGFSRAQSEQMLRTFFSDISDPKTMNESRLFVGGRTEFKGTTMQQYRVASEDPQRSRNENFFHIGGGQSYGLLGKIAQIGPAVVQVEGVTEGGRFNSSPVEPVQTAQTIDLSEPSKSSPVAPATSPTFNVLHQRRQRRVYWQPAATPALSQQARQAAIKPAIAPAVLNKVAAFVQVQKQLLARVMSRPKPSVAVAVANHSPTSPAQIATMNSDTSRPAQRTHVYSTTASVGENAQGQRAVVVARHHDTAHLDDWYQATGLPRTSEHSLMDSALAG